MEQLDDPIEVATVFGTRGMRLVWVGWQGRRRMIQRVCYQWAESDGAKLLRHFSVTDGSLWYELCFDTRELRWRLMKISSADGG